MTCSLQQLKSLQHKTVAEQPPHTHMSTFVRNLSLLAAGQSLMMSGSSLVVTTAPLVGLALANDESMAALPLAAMHLATLLTSIPAAMLMARFGRKAGFSGGAVAGTLGAAVATLGVMWRSLELVIIGTFFIGVFNGFANYFRFAAADAAPPERRGIAVSWVLAGGIVAAVVGPALAQHTWDLLGEAFAASYAALIGVYVLCLFVVLPLRLPKPQADTSVETPSARRTLRQIVSQPRYIAAMLCATFGYAAMTFMMTATPLAMKGHGHAFGHTVSVVQWHIMGMFAPSLVTGRLVRRFGVVAVLLAGVALEGTAVTINLLGTSVVHFRLALIALGVGWNFLFIGATTLLTETYAPHEQARAQGFNDFVVFSTVAMATLSAGALHHLLGWRWVNLAVVPLLVIVVVSIVIVTRTPSSRPGKSR